MISIKCETKDKITLTEMTPFQGTLKKRTQNDLDELKQSLIKEGLLMPFAVWQHDDKKYILDGHGRREALLQLLTEDPKIIDTEFPCIMITANTEDDARKALLQITSQYGKITKQGVKQFTVSIPDYTAPAIKKFQPRVPKVTKTPKQSENHIIKLRVKKEYVAKVLEVLKQFDYIEVL